MYLPGSLAFLLGSITANPDSEMSDVIVLKILSRGERFEGWGRICMLFHPFLLFFLINQGPMGSLHMIEVVRLCRAGLMYVMLLCRGSRVVG